MASGTINKHGATFDLLWTNSDPTANFAAQTVSLDLSAYDAVLIIYLANLNRNAQYSRICLKNGYSNVLLGVISASSDIRTRTANVTDSGVDFGAGYTGTSSANSSNIPYLIYGIKGIPT